MGQAKRQLEDRFDEEMMDWIREQIGDPSATEDSPEWAELEQQYLIEQDDIADREAYEVEIEWLESTSNNESFELFHKEMVELRALLSEARLNDNITLLKMSHAHSVTLLETYLGDAFKRLLLESEYALSSASREIEELRKAKFSIAEVSASAGSIPKLALGALDGISFHNISKVKRLISGAIGQPLKVDVGPVSKIVMIRHDIVHRNGKTADGDALKFSYESVIYNQ